MLDVGMNGVYVLYSYFSIWREMLEECGNLSNFSFPQKFRNHSDMVLDSETKYWKHEPGIYVRGI